MAEMEIEYSCFYRQIISGVLNEYMFRLFNFQILVSREGLIAASPATLSSKRFGRWLTHAV